MHFEASFLQIVAVSLVITSTFALAVKIFELYKADNS